jgi:hypothetical protein
MYLAPLTYAWYYGALLAAYLVHKHIVQVQLLPLQLASAQRKLLLNCPAQGVLHIDVDPPPDHQIRG